MERIDEFADDRQKSWCIHCTRWLAELETTEDHVPTKSFLVKPRPHHLPVVTICRDCNNGFSRDEQYAVTFLSCVLVGSTDPEKQRNPSAARALSESAALRAMIDRTKKEFQTAAGETRIVWQPDMDRIDRVALKNARGHAYFEYGEPKMEAPVHVWARPLESMAEDERVEFEGLSEANCLAAWPEVGSRMMTRIATGLDMDGGWVFVQDGTYRYAVNDAEGLRVRSIIWEYLATEVYWEHQGFDHHHASLTSYCLNLCVIAARPRQAKFHSGFPPCTENFLYMLCNESPRFISSHDFGSEQFVIAGEGMSYVILQFNTYCITQFLVLPVL